MDSKALKAACVDVGLIIIEEVGGSWTAVTPTEEGTPYAYSWKNPALPAVVAERYRKLIHELGYSYKSRYEMKLTLHAAPGNHWAVLASPQERIWAAQETLRAIEGKCTDITVG